jgi:hypothetical protein
MGGNESYVALCRRHFMLGEITPKKWQDKKSGRFSIRFFRIL